MISIARFIFNPYQENTYVVWDDKGECIVVDAGCSDAREQRALAEFIASKNLKPVLAANTHGHFDHLPGVDWVKATYGVPFAIDFRDNFLLENTPMQGRLYGFEITSAPVAEIDLGGATPCAKDAGAEDGTASACEAQAVRPGREVRLPPPSEVVAAKAARLRERLLHDTETLLSN